MLRTLGLLFLALITVAAGGFAFLHYQDRQARDFVVAVTPIVYKDWNADAMINRFTRVQRTPEFEAQVKDMFRMFEPHLGPLVSAEPPEGKMRYGQPHEDLPSMLYGKYRSQAKFRDAEAELDFTVLKEQGAWRIAEFKVSSEAMFAALKQKGPAKASGKTWNRGPPEEEAAVRAEADEVLRIMDSEDPGASWNRGSLAFQEANTKRRFVADFKNLREKTGHLQNRRSQGIGFMFDKPNANPAGDYAVADYVSTYSRATLEERLGFYRQQGQWKFSGYHWRRVDQQQ